MSSESLRARSPFFSFDTETGSRRPRWIAALAGLMAILFIVTGVGVGLGAANAHTPTVKVDCYGVTVKLQSYNTNNNGQNSLKIVIAGSTVVDTANFGTSFPETTYKFANPSATNNTWSVKVVAHDDDGDNGWNVDESGTAPSCDAPAATLTSTECNTIDGTTTVTATFSKLLNGLTYTAQLFKNDVPFQGAFTPSTASAKIWTNMDAGVTYKVTVTSTQYSGLTATTQTVVVGCPQNNALVVKVVECTSPTKANSSVTVTASQLVVGRTYTAMVYQGATAITGAIPVTQGTSTSVDFSIDVPPSTSGLTVVLTDTLAATTVTSASFATKPCPSDPGVPTVTSEVCTQVGQDGSLTVTVSLTGLTAGRVYLVQIDGAQVAEVTAAGTSQSGLVYSVAPGVHTVTIVDKLVPSLTKTSAPVDVKACPTQPEITLIPTECQEAGAKGSIAVTFSGLAAGREYSVTITENGNAVPGYPGAATVSSTQALAPYTNLDPGKTYTVTVTDKLATAVKDAASIALKPCPMTPEVNLTLECLFLEGDSLISAKINDLAPGEEYVVAISDDAKAAPTALGGMGGGTAVVAAGAPVDSTTVTGSATPTTVTFQVPNNLTYTVTVTKVTNAKVTGSAAIFAAICDLPTFDLPPELPTLALTGGGDTTMPMLGALGLVQFGFALLALAAMLQFTPRRRTAL
ncbi:hypothetical protein [Pseudolysinimonas sp.]|jgi:hypothetical protein|uniref:hypothetical protein n=1 Tax=Pseudolysinimonas sp. TaxID=2680009 RepID=UPI003783DB2F